MVLDRVEGGFIGGRGGGGVEHQDWCNIEGRRLGLARQCMNRLSSSPLFTQSRPPVKPEIVTFSEQHQLMDCSPTNSVTWFVAPCCPCFPLATRDQSRHTAEVTKVAWNSQVT